MVKIAARVARLAWSVVQHIPTRRDTISNSPPLATKSFRTQPRTRAHLLKHDIAAELPQLKEEIQTLKADNAQFAKLLASYDLLNPTVTTVETTGGAGAVKVFLLVYAALSGVAQQRVPTASKCVRYRRTSNSNWW